MRTPKQSLNVAIDGGGSGDGFFACGGVDFRDWMRLGVEGEDWAKDIGCLVLGIKADLSVGGARGVDWDLLGLMVSAREGARVYDELPGVCGEGRVG